MTRLYILALMGCLFSACQGTTEQKTEVNFAADRGRVIYDEYCASCHGANMSGGQAPSMSDATWEYGGTDDDIRSIIKVGNDDVGMPAFGDVLQGKQISDLLSYIRSGSDTNTTPPTDDVASVQDEVRIQTWAGGLNEPWAVHFIGADTALVTEKTGKLWQVSSDTRIEIEGMPGSANIGQGGLLDVAVDPDYAANGWVYLSFAHAVASDPDLLMTKIVRGKVGVNTTWTDEQTLFEAKPQHYLEGGRHFGSRITFDNRGHLYFSVGDRGHKDMAQDLTKPNGKIHRIRLDGTIPKDNPFIKTEGVYPSIYSYGNRNPQGTIVHPETQVLWETEHGPKGGDELNVIKSGANYGWPKISYGRNYNGTVLTPHTSLPGMIQPVSQWTPSIATCGLDVYTGDLFPEWKGRLMAGALAHETVRLIEVDGEAYISEVSLIKGEGRVRDVTTGPDGAIYVALPTRIVRISPKI